MIVYAEWNCLLLRPVKQVPGLGDPSKAWIAIQGYYAECPDLSSVVRISQAERKFRRSRMRLQGVFLAGPFGEGVDLAPRIGLERPLILVAHAWHQLGLQQLMPRSVVHLVEIHPNWGVEEPSPLQGRSFEAKQSRSSPAPAEE